MNNALRDEDKAKSDQTLMAVVLFGLYEVFYDLPIIDSRLLNFTRQILAALLVP